MGWGTGSLVGSSRSLYDAQRNASVRGLTQTMSAGGITVNGEGGLGQTVNSYNAAMGQGVGAPVHEGAYPAGKGDVMAQKPMDANGLLTQGATGVRTGAPTSGRDMYSGQVPTGPMNNGQVMSVTQGHPNTNSVPVTPVAPVGAPPAPPMNPIPPQYQQQVSSVAGALPGAAGTRAGTPTMSHPNAGYVSGSSPAVAAPDPYATAANGQPNWQANWKPQDQAAPTAAAPFGTDPYGTPFASAAQASDWRARDAARTAALSGYTFADQNHDRGYT